MTDTLTIGDTYRVTSSRKGTFTGVLTYADQTWADILITGGKAKAMLDHNEREAGEVVRVRISFCAFTKVGGVEA